MSLPDPPIAQLKAIAHPLRFRVLEVLKSGERNVGEIEAASGIGQPALSQQLGVLRKAGLVTTRKKAKLVFYKRAEPTIAALIESLANENASDELDTKSPDKSSSTAANFARMS